MKVKGLCKGVLIVAGMLTITLTGCGKNQVATVTPTKEPVPTIAPAEEAAAETVTPEPTKSPGDKDTGEVSEAVITQTPLEDVGGEGAIDRTLPDITGLEESPIGEPVKFTNEAGEEVCLFAIESIESSDLTIQNMDDVPDAKVVVVGYSYTNMTAEGNLLFDDMSFKMLADNTVCMPYFSPNLTPAAPSGEGETAFGQVAFWVPQNCMDVTVVFDNSSINAKTIFKATLK